jgi:hypothetical protein
MQLAGVEGYIDALSFQNAHQGVKKGPQKSGPGKKREAMFRDYAVPHIGGDQPSRHRWRFQPGCRILFGSLLMLMNYVQNTGQRL